MYKYLVFSILILTLISCGSATQAQSNGAYTPSKSLKKAYDNGLQAKKFENYSEAIHLFSKCIEKDDKFIDARIQRASCYIKSGQQTLGISDINYVLEKYPTYRTDLYYPLGKACLEIGDYECAASSFDSFIKAQGNEHFLFTDARAYREQALNAAEFKADSVTINVYSLSGNINTAAGEYLPVFTLDGNEMIFTRREGLQEDFYSSKYDGNSWSSPKYLEGINTPLSEGAQTISGDGSFMLFTGCNRPDGHGNCDIYYSVRNGDRWSTPKNCGKTINSPTWDTQPSLTVDGKRFYFASRRKGGYGGTDIYYVDFLGKGKWSEPVNLGPEINTKKEDFTPFIHADGRTLYFTSNGHTGLGSSDIFMSSLKLDGSWSDPVNAGYPINTHKEEGALAVAPDGKTAYFSREVGQGSERNLDIFYFELPEYLQAIPTTYVRLNVINDDGQAIKSIVSLFDVNTDSLLVNKATRADGSILFPLLTGSNYGLQVQAEGYTFYSEYIQLDSVFGSLDPYERRIRLTRLPVEDGAISDDSVRLTLNNIFWETGSAQLLSTSERELNVLVDLLRAHHSYSILIEGHTDNVGSDSDNQVLSEQRAQAVKSYLMSSGLSSSRVRTIGYGEQRPIDTNDTSDGRQNNRRVEVRFVK